LIAVVRCGILTLAFLVMGRQGRATMKRFAMALLLGAFATTALAADARYFVVTDTVGNCSVVDSKPGQSSGLKIVGDKGGYSSSDAASKVLKDMTKKCKGVVE
jgi:hypothetical protein